MTPAGRRYVAGFDIDGVIGDFVTSFRAVAKARYSVDLAEADIRAHDLFLALGVSREESIDLIRETLEYTEYALYPGARDGLARLVREGLEIHIVTARWNGRANAAELTEAWLASRGLERGVHYHRIDAVREGSKYDVGAAMDSFVDDNLVELIEMAANKTVDDLIVFDHPWNQTRDVHRRFHRVTSWDELVAYLSANAREAPRSVLSTSGRQDAARLSAASERT